MDLGNRDPHPFGTDPVAAVSFTVEGLGMTSEGWRQIRFGTTANSGDAANLADPWITTAFRGTFSKVRFGLDPHSTDTGSLPALQNLDGQQALAFTQPAGIKGLTYGAEWSGSGEWGLAWGCPTAPSHQNTSSTLLPATGRAPLSA
ncbi:MAG: hypothetical protein H7A50_11770 [Akkermansiaceae bacterium]|nr:hypothetical protein [Akkermansiaceae bacterium]